VNDWHLAAKILKRKRDEWLHLSSDHLLRSMSRHIHGATEPVWPWQYVEKSFSRRRHLLDAFGDSLRYDCKASTDATLSAQCRCVAGLSYGDRFFKRRRLISRQIRHSHIQRVLLSAGPEGACSYATFNRS
jgi:hypothetical protein